MKRRNYLKTSLLFVAMILPSCTLGMTQKNLASGKAYIASLLEKYATDVPQFNLSSASVKISINEKYTVLNSKKKEESVIKSTFSLAIDYASTEEKPYSALLAATRMSNGTSSYYEYSIEKASDTTYQIKSDEVDRVADPNEDFYSYYDVPYFLNVSLNRNAVRFLDSSLTTVKLDSSSSSVQSSSDEEEKAQSNILTGYNINYYQNSDTWTYSIFSEDKYHVDDEVSFGFDDASYTRFFRYSGIEAVPASNIKYTFSNDRVSKYESSYSYYDEELKEQVRGKITLEAEYGSEKEKTEI